MYIFPCYRSTGRERRGKSHPFTLQVHHSGRMLDAYCAPGAALGPGEAAGRQKYAQGKKRPSERRCDDLGNAAGRKTDLHGVLQGGSLWGKGFRVVMCTQAWLEPRLGRAGGGRVQTAHAETPSCQGTEKGGRGVGSREGVSYHEI